MSEVMKSNPQGFHTSLTNQVKERVIEATSQVIVLPQIAALSGVPLTTLRGWLHRGAKDKIGGIESIFAQLSSEFYKARGEVVRDLLNQLRSCPKNYGALTWILEKCFKEDFGAESEEMKELRELFKSILPLIGKGELFNVNSQNAKAYESQEDYQESQTEESHESSEAESF